MKWEIALAIITGLFFTASSLGTCIMVGLGNSVWATMSGQSKFLMVVGIFVNWSGTMTAWINRAISDLRKGKLPLPPGSSSDTSMLTKSDVPPIAGAMKTALALTLCGWVILIFGCTATMQRQAVNTIGSIETGATATVDGYFSLVVQGKLPTNNVPEVTKAYNSLQQSVKLSLDLVQGNTNALAPGNLIIEATDLGNLVKQVEGK